MSEKNNEKELEFYSLEEEISKSIEEARIQKEKNLLSELEEALEKEEEDKKIYEKGDKILKAVETMLNDTPKKILELAQEIDEETAINDDELEDLRIMKKVLQKTADELRQEREKNQNFTGKFENKKGLVKLWGEIKNFFK